MGTIKTEQSLDSELYLNSSYEKATGCLSTGWQVLVEMTGIEPVSESISSGLSPSAAIDLKFRVCCRPIAGCSFGYPVVPLCCQDFT